MIRSPLNRHPLGPTGRDPAGRRPVTTSAALCVALGLLTGCGGGGGSLTGDWGGDDCIYKQLSFQRGGSVYITPMLFGMELPTSEARYEVDGDRVTIYAHDGNNLTFTRDGNSLRGGGLVGTCVRL